MLSDTDKTDKHATLRKLDAVAEAQGYVTRQAHKRRRVPNPRTGQLHAKVLPQVYEEILLESKRRGVQQGVLIEEIWNMRMPAHVYWQITELAKARGLRQGELLEETWQLYQETVSGQPAVSEDAQTSSAQQ